MLQSKRPVCGVRCSSGVELLYGVFVCWISVVRGLPIVVVTDKANDRRRRFRPSVVDSVSNRVLARNHCITRSTCSSLVCFS